MGRHRAGLLRLPLLAVTLLGIAAADSSAQAPATEIRANALTVFLDCSGNPCDSEYFRTEVDFVNWVRDRTLAQVHLIITSNETGGGGDVFTLDFVGLQDLEGRDDELALTTFGTDTEDEVLDRLSRVIGAGLARYSTLVGQAGAFRVSAAAPDTGAPESLVTAQNVDDPWDFWVFEVSADLELQGEETERQRRQGGSFEARRTTPTWKLEMEIDGNRSRDEREREDGSLIVDERTFWDAGVLLAYALADHWSLGVISGAGASTRRNQDLGADAAAVLEYSLFPYEDAPRQSLTARYGMGLQYFDWEEETVYFQTEELRVQQHAQVQLFQRQQWGESRVSIEARQFLHDLGKWSASISGDVEFRVFRGLELEVSGELGFIEDQLFISREGLTDDEILLGRFERPTDMVYELSIGFGFEFGSIYNNVVNNRF